ncbi:hypothetical protein [Haloarchaeobius iranensis]
MIEVLTGDTAPIYELVYDGQDDGAEPEITPVGEDEQSPKPSK